MDSAPSRLSLLLYSRSVVILYTPTTKPTGGVGDRIACQRVCSLPPPPPFFFTQLLRIIHSPVLVERWWRVLLEANLCNMLI